MAKKQTKDETFWAILNSALELDFRRGHMKWTVSELSRKSGITRSLIYYHFGRSKTAILEEAVKVIGEELIGIGPERLEQWKNGDWATSVRRAREITQQSPYLVQFYLLHRERPTQIGAHLKSLETKYLAKLKKNFPLLREAGHRALFALFFGVIFSPLVDDSAVVLVLNSIRGLAGDGRTPVPVG